MNNLIPAIDKFTQYLRSAGQESNAIAQQEVGLLNQDTIEKAFDNFSKLPDDQKKAGLEQFVQKAIRTNNTGLIPIVNSLAGEAEKSTAYEISYNTTKDLYKDMPIYGNNGKAVKLTDSEHFKNIEKIVNPELKLNALSELIKSQTDKDATVGYFGGNKPIQIATTTASGGQRTYSIKNGVPTLDGQETTLPSVSQKAYFDFITNKKLGEEQLILKNNLATEKGLTLAQQRGEQLKGNKFGFIPETGEIVTIAYDNQNNARVKYLSGKNAGKDVDLNNTNVQPGEVQKIIAAKQGNIKSVEKLREEAIEDVKNLAMDLTALVDGKAVPYLKYELDEKKQITEVTGNDSGLFGSPYYKNKEDSIIDPATNKVSLTKLAKIGEGLIAKEKNKKPLTDSETKILARYRQVKEYDAMIASYNEDIKQDNAALRTVPEENRSPEINELLNEQENIADGLSAAYGSSDTTYTKKKKAVTNSPYKN